MEHSDNEFNSSAYGATTNDAIYQIAILLGILPGPFTLYGWWSCRPLFWICSIIEVVSLILSVWRLRNGELGKRIIEIPNLRRTLFNVTVFPYVTAVTGLLILEHGNDIFDSYIPFTSTECFLGAVLMFIFLLIVDIHFRKREKFTHIRSSGGEK